MNYRKGFWRSDSWGLKLGLVMGVVLAAVSVWLVNHLPYIRVAASSSNAFYWTVKHPEDPGVLSAALFFILGYFTAVPVLATKMILLSRQFPVKKKLPPGEKVFLSILSLSLASAAISAPYLILASGGGGYWKSRIVYTLITKSYLGLSLAGSAALYVMAAGVWMMFYFVPLIWLGRKVDVTS